MLWQVYVWGRRHPYVNLSFLGIFNFTAPYLPWVLLAFSLTLRSNAVSDLLGIVAGERSSRLPMQGSEGILHIYVQSIPALSGG